MGIFSYLCAENKLHSQFESKLSLRSLALFFITKDMEQRLIGREAELKLLNEYINSDRSEFIAVYGRRRVGKTFLIRKAVEDHFAFFMTGMN